MAIIAQNFASLFIIMSLVIMKDVKKEGFNPSEFVMLRSSFHVRIGITWCYCAGLHPIKMFPRDKKYSLILRSFLGHLNTFLLIQVLDYLPVTLVTVCWQTNPFWISLIARIWLKEKIILLELIGMIICFCMVGTIAFQAKM